MFHTFPSAELPMAIALSTAGERSWRWIEFGLQIPYFLASLRVVSADVEMGRQLLLSRLDDVLGLAAQQDASCQLAALELLSPDYMNGTAHYQLGTVKKVWRSRRQRLCQRFLLADDTQLWFDVEGVAPDEAEMELVLAL